MTPFEIILETYVKNEYLIELCLKYCDKITWNLDVKVGIYTAAKYYTVFFYKITWNWLNGDY